MITYQLCNRLTFNNNITFTKEVDTILSRHFLTMITRMK